MVPLSGCGFRSHLKPVLGPCSLVLLDLFLVFVVDPKRLWLGVLGSPWRVSPNVLRCFTALVWSPVFLGAIYIKRGSHLGLLLVTF